LQSGSGSGSSPWPLLGAIAAVAVGLVSVLSIRTATRLALSGRPARPVPARGGREVLDFIQLLGPRLRHSRRLPYRISRVVAFWLAYSCVLGGITVVLVRVLALG
jgi:hypothetical protein